MQSSQFVMVAAFGYAPLLTRLKLGNQMLRSEHASASTPAPLILLQAHPIAHHALS
jgi:hypothetical protein